MVQYLCKYCKNFKEEKDYIIEKYICKKCFQERIYFCQKCNYYNLKNTCQKCGDLINEVVDNYS